MKPWEESPLKRLLGRDIGYKTLCAQVRKLWDLQGDFEIIELGFGYFIFKLSDRSKVLIRGTWIIMEHYLTA